MAAQGDVAVLVFEARRALAKTEEELAEKQRRVAQLAESVAGAAAEERRRHASFLAAGHKLEAALFSACGSARSLQQLQAYESLTAAWLREDHLTLLNARAELSKLREEASARIEALRRDRRLAAEAASTDRGAHVVNTREAQLHRDEFATLQQQIKEVEAHAHSSMLRHGRDVFHVFAR